MLTRPDALDLHLKFEFPERQAAGAVLLIHGYGEHSGRYDEVAQALVDRGFAVGRFDLRGHGRSPGIRGHISAFRDYLDDTFAVLHRFEIEEPVRSTGLPVLFGHSCGALIAIHAALQAPRRFRALALSSPYLGLSLEVPAWKKQLGRWFSKHWPTFSQPTGITGALVTHDPVLAAAVDRDPLMVRRATARFFTEAEAAQQEAVRRAPELVTPLFCLAAGDDRVASLATTRAFFDRVGARDKTLEVVPAAYHEVLNELERAEHLTRLLRAVERFTQLA